MTINDAIEEFLESDFEIKASNAAKKAEQNSKRFSMFNPAKLLSPLFSQGDQAPPVYDPYVEKSQLTVFESESGEDFKAALLLHDFTSIVCLQDAIEDSSTVQAPVEYDEEVESTIYILAKKQSN